MLKRPCFNTGIPARNQAHHKWTIEEECGAVTQPALCPILEGRAVGVSPGGWAKTKKGEQKEAMRKEAKEAGKVEESL